MSVDQELLGRRLKEARENRQMSQEQAAQAIGIPRTALLKVEAGKRSLSTLEFASLARLYGRSTADFFRESDTLEDRSEDPLLILHRYQPGLFDNPQVKGEVSRCFDLCSIGVDLLKKLGMLDSMRLPLYRLRSPTRPSDATEQGERVADEERARLGLGYGPIADMAELIATQGVWASGVRDLSEEMAGIFLSHETIGLVILVHLDNSRPRKRFSYAHEYAHALMDRENSTVIVSNRANHRDHIERRANAFAAAFLMPAEGVRWFLRIMDKGGYSKRYRVTYTSVEEPVAAEDRSTAGSQQITFQDVLALANHFGVSYPAAVYRLDDLGFLGSNEKEALVARKDSAARLRHHYRSDVAKPDRELTHQVLWLAVEAKRRGLISQGRLNAILEKLDLPEDEINDLVEAEG